MHNEGEALKYRNGAQAAGQATEDRVEGEGNQAEDSHFVERTSVRRIYSLLGSQKHPLNEILEECALQALWLGDCSSKQNLPGTKHGSAL